MAKTDTSIIDCLVHGTFELVDDADVGRPVDDERHVEVEDACSESVGRDQSARMADVEARPATEVHVRPHQHRDVERHVVAPYADDSSQSYAGFQSRSTDLIHSQESTQQLQIITIIMMLICSILNIVLVFCV